MRRRRPSRFSSDARTRAAGFLSLATQLAAVVACCDDHDIPNSIVIAALLSLVAAAPASAKYRVGVGEQNPQMFDTPTWQSLKLKRVRYLVPWDYAKHAGQRTRSTTSWPRARATSRTCS